ncbi:hypothetical protein FRB90_000251 [Tulasnella sp. 427]|nr:hypothetical protein FRB90_000251 [Tulasnella sp. 427]
MKKSTSSSTSADNSGNASVPTNTSARGQGHSRAGRDILTMAATSGTLIHKLPAELLVEVFKHSTSTNTPLQSAMALRGVCSHWDQLLKNAPGFWRKIDAREGVALIQQAVPLARDLSLDFSYMAYSSDQKTQEFINGLDGNITAANLRSLTATGTAIASALLGSADAPRLETLILSADRILSPAALALSIVTLFDGHSAPLSLKHVSLSAIGIALGPMQLSGLKSLQLSCMPQVTAEELFRVIAASPELESLDLHWGARGDERLESDNVEDQVNGTPNTLPALRSVTFKYLPPRFAQLLWSRFIFPNLREAQIGGCAGDTMILLNIAAKIPHFTQALAQTTSKATEIEISPISKISMGCCAAIAGGLTVALAGIISAHNNYHNVAEMDEVMTWIKSHLGARFAELPIRFTMDLYLNPELLTALRLFKPQTKITYLSLSPTKAILENDIEAHLKLLGQQGRSSFGEWALPYLEVLETNLINHKAGGSILEIIRSRNVAALVGEHGAPRKLREVQLSMGGKARWDSSVEIHPEIKRAVLEAADGTAVFWYGKQWTLDVHM